MDIDSRNKLQNEHVKEVSDAIYKKAVGYESKDVVEEYTKNAEGNMEVIKRKISTKQNPPDIAAAKIIMQQPVSDKYDGMSIEELQQEINRLKDLLNLSN